MNGYLIMVYGSWGSEPYSYVNGTLDEAKAKAKEASRKNPQNEYCVEIEPGGFDNPLYRAGESIGGE